MWNDTDIPNTTLKMRQSGYWNSEQSPWVDKGSKRYLWNEQSVARAIEYVLFGQGDELPDLMTRSEPPAVAGR